MLFKAPAAVFSLYEIISVRFSDKPRIVPTNPFRKFEVDIMKGFFESEMSELDSNIIAVTGLITKK
jgi:hypothetical protein